MRKRKSIFMAEALRKRRIKMFITEAMKAYFKKVREIKQQFDDGLLDWDETLTKINDLTDETFTEFTRKYQR